MKVVLQRVLQAEVRVDGAVSGEIGPGLLLLVGLGKDDDEKKLAPLAAKLCNMRVFEDEGGRFDKSVLDVQGGVLLVSQFTLLADTKKGRRPDFFNAMEPARASALFDRFVEEFRALGVSPVATGVFGAHMKVSLVNDGPVTIVLEM